MNARLVLSLLPNLITLARLLAVPIAVYAILSEAFVAAFWIFVLAGVSDAIDGAIAKRFRVTSELGAYLDPLADKALLVGVYITLSQVDQLPVWLVILVVFRDILIVGGALLFHTLTQSLKMEPLFISKVNTTAQIVLAIEVLARLAFGLEAPLLYGALVGAVTATTIASGGAYVYKWGTRAIHHQRSLGDGQ